MTLLEFFENKSFKNKIELFHALKDNEDIIIDQKKSKIYQSKDKGQGVINFPIYAKSEANKSRFESGYIYPVINSTHWLDSHQDVHIKGCYTKTVKEQQGKVYYIDSHLKGLSNIISTRKNIEMFIDDIEWSLLGKNNYGTTESLLFKIAEDKVKPDYLKLIKEDNDLENSFAMRYIKIKMALDSTDKEFAENRDTFYNYIDSIANKEQATKDGIFFAVEELAIVGEGSLCPVVGGSNSATRVIYEPDNSTLENKEEPSGDTPPSEQKKNINVNFY